MLVVTRKVGERIVIGDNVTLTVVRIAGGLVRLGVEAPPDCVVVRRELLDSKNAPSQTPANPSTGDRSAE